MRNFFWEGQSGSKINHLVNWKKVILSQLDGGLGLGGIKIQNTALLAKWGWRFLVEEPFDWHTVGKSSNSLKSHWVSISRAWRKVEALALLSLVMEEKLLFGKTYGSVTSPSIFNSLSS